MDRFKLNVRQRRPDQDRETVLLCVKKALEIRHAADHRGVRRRHEEGVPGPVPADPVLTATKLPGIFLASTSPREEPLVNLADEPGAERKSGFEPLRPWAANPT